MDHASARADSVTGDTVKAVVAVIGLLVTGVVWAFGAIAGGAVLD